MMGKPVFLDPIDYISGKISKKFRTIYCRRKESDRRFTSVHGERTTPTSAAETINRMKFGAVSVAVNGRMHDLNKISQDQAAFIAQKATGYKTLRSYLWALEAEAYDDAQG